MKKLRALFLLQLAVLCITLTSCADLIAVMENESEPASKTEQQGSEEGEGQEEGSKEEISIDSLPEFSGEPYIVIQNNQPEFEEEYFTTNSFEDYSELDDLGRCGPAFANLSRDTMPTEKRGDIGQVKPTGWRSVEYDCVESKHLYNRCHLIGFQLSGENANKENLITGTRYLNVQGMLPFEDMVADYIKETGNHVLYRVTPIFEGDNLIASGVQMEGMSVEDNGEGICFNVYCYNVQPQISIDYATGESKLSEDSLDGGAEEGDETFILNVNSRKFHKPSCSSISDISKENKEEYRGSRDGIISQGYDPCGRCNP